MLIGFVGSDPCGRSLVDLFARCLSFCDAFDML